MLELNRSLLKREKVEANKCCESLLVSPYLQSNPSVKYYTYIFHLVAKRLYTAFSSFDG